MGTLEKRNVAVSYFQRSGNLGSVNFRSGNCGSVNCGNVNCRSVNCGSGNCCGGNCGSSIGFLDNIADVASVW